MAVYANPLAKLLERLDTAWAAFRESYAGLSDAQLVEPGVAGDWSVRDVLAHVTTWEEEALLQLPVISAGGRPPRYAAVGGIDAFNARMHAQKRGLPLADVRRQLDETHRRLIDYLRSAPVEQLRPESRFRRRLRLDTDGHYRLHTAMISAWRTRQPALDAR